MYEIPIFKIKVFRSSVQTVEHRKINHPSKVASVFHALMGQLHQEYLVVFCVNKQNDFVGHGVIAMGTIDEVPADRGLIANLVTSIRGTAGWIIIHNHVSGDTTPSPEDKSLFKSMIRLGFNIDRHLLDAIIVGNSPDDPYYSHIEKSPYDFINRDRD